MAVREEPLFPVSGVYDQAKGWCCEATTGWILTERILSLNPRPGFKAFPTVYDAGLVLYGLRLCCKDKSYDSSLFGLRFESGLWYMMLLALWSQQHTTMWLWINRSAH